ncbi:MAG: 50S ribosomal protein L6 [Erysipelotrichaceae bacterium]|nr:50S ribosomal protein L6 [Erysipelotrichaceae bacterium]
MSRIGKRTLIIPEKVNVELNEQKLTVKGPKGELSLNIEKCIKVNIEDSKITVEPVNQLKHTREMHGTTNANIKNMLIGVTEGYTKGLEIVGVGYRFTVKGNTLSVQDGKSHLDNIEIPADITVKQVSNTEIELSGIDKCAIGKFAAEIRDLRKPEPYKGKGIHYVGEHLRRKEGKKASK